MKRRLAAAVPLVLVLAFAVLAERPPGPVVHEWGTFTTLAGFGGRPVAFRPFDGPDDLPEFVSRDYVFPKRGLSARVRMETPVVYFYSEDEIDVSVAVSFPGGHITEWFPEARRGAGTIEWPAVRVRPGAAALFPFEDARESHYYRARETDSAPIEVSTESGPEREKFLFYRGAGDFDVPATARLDSGVVFVANRSAHPVESVIVFERRGGVASFTDPASLGAGEERAFERPAAPRDLEDLLSTLRRTLVDAGLFEREARCMVETWRDDWFGEGLRVFSVVPRAITDAILPISISPEPESLERVLVARAEIPTPEAVLAVARLRERMRSGDDADRAAAYREAFEAGGRFLSPVLEGLDRADSRARARSRLDSYLFAAEGSR